MGRSPGRPSGIFKTPCGTVTGHRRHYRLGEKPCQACRRAHSEYLQAKKKPSTPSRLLDVLNVNGGWVSLDLAADLLDVDVTLAKKTAYRLRSRGVIEMRVTDAHRGLAEARVAHDSTPSRTWTVDAACAGSTIDFFPGEREHKKIATAVAVCESCKVRDECLAFAFATQSEGVWGGTTDSERRQMLEAA